MNTLVIAAAAVATNVTVTLPPVVVEASRLARVAAEMPSDVQVITRSQVVESGANNLTELLSQKVPSLAFHHVSGNNPAATQITPLGYGENGFGRLLVLVDGERLNNPDMSGQNLAQVPFGSIRQIEILNGPQTVLHGNNAAGGVVNVITDAQDDGTHGKVEIHGGSWGSVGGSLSLRGGLPSAGTHYWAHGGWDHSDGYRSRTSFDTYTAGGGVRQDFDNGSSLRFSSFFDDATYEVPGELTRDEWKSAPTLSKDLSIVGHGDYRRTTFGVRSTAYGVVDEENDVKVDLGVSRRHMQADAHMGGVSYGYVWSSLDDRDYDTYVFDVSPQWINRTSVFSLENELTVGSLYRFERLHALQSSDYGYGPSVSKYALNRHDMGFFVSDTCHLTDWLSVEAGGRYERLWNENTQALSSSLVNDLYAYDASLLLAPTEDFKAYLRFARYFNAPHLDETVGGYDAAFNYVQERMLKAEHGWRGDLGCDYSFLDGGFLGGDLFLGKSEDEVMYFPAAPYKNNMNSPWDILRYGFNGRIGWEKEKVAGLALRYAYVDATFDGGEYDGNRVPLVSRQTVSADGRVYLWDECFVFGGYRYQTDQFCYSDFANDGYGSGRHNRIPSYGLFRAGAQYAPTYGWLNGVRVGFAVENLFDKNYCDYAGYGTYYWPGVGRCYTFTVSYEF